MKLFVFHVYEGNSHSFYEISFTANNLAEAWRGVASEILFIEHVRAIEFINFCEV